MAVTMTLEELREHIRTMPEDEILRITFEVPGGKEGDHAGEEGSCNVPPRTEFPSDRKFAAN